jgi:SAM-dependent methyltransferase
MDSKQRFSSRVENYIKYRPGYPLAVVETLRQECGLSPASAVADVGSGTGILASLFLEEGCQVIGVEPNADMRAAGERLLAGYPRFTSLDGSAERTGLQDHSIDMITAGQAFHWFDPSKARREFERILAADGWVVLVWNERRTDTSPLLRDYEALLQRFATDYNQINHRNVETDPEVIPAFYRGPFRVERFDNQQVFDYPGLEGRLLSSSYTPEPGSPTYQPMLDELQQIFTRHQQNGGVTFEYDTRMFFGRLE